LGFEQVKPHAQLLPLQQSTINNQQSSLGNHHSAIITRQSSLGNHHSAIINPMEKMQSGGLRTQAEKCRPPG
jgi:hypothetical protein